MESSQFSRNRNRFGIENWLGIVLGIESNQFSGNRESKIQICARFPNSNVHRYKTHNYARKRIKLQFYLLDILLRRSGKSVYKFDQRRGTDSLQRLHEVFRSLWVEVFRLKSSTEPYGTAGYCQYPSCLDLEMRDTLETEKCFHRKSFTAPTASLS